MTVVHWPVSQVYDYQTTSEKKADTKKHQPDTKILQPSEIKIEQENSIKQERIDQHPTARRLTDKLINTILSNNIDEFPKFAGKPDENVNKWLTDVTNELARSLLPEATWKSYVGNTVAPLLVNTSLF